MVPTAGRTTRRTRVNQGPSDLPSADAGLQGSHRGARTAKAAIPDSARRSASADERGGSARRSKPSVGLGTAAAQKISSMTGGRPVLSERTNSNNPPSPMTPVRLCSASAPQLSVTYSCPSLC
jgi:hypothetical protein